MMKYTNTQTLAHTLRCGNTHTLTRDTLTHWRNDTLTHSHVDTLTLWHTNTVTHWHTDAPTQWFADTLSHWHPDTLTHWHTDTLTHSHTEIHWHRNILTNWRTDMLCKKESRLADYTLSKFKDEWKSFFMWICIDATGAIRRAGVNNEDWHCWTLWTSNTIAKYAGRPKTPICWPSKPHCSRGEK